MSDAEFSNDGVAQGVRGVAVGVVTDNEDPEGLGRVKLTFPWRESEDESHWARIATPMGGAEMGAFFLPEVDDEVLVGFVDGNVDYPYVIGSLWNEQQPPPEDNADGDNDVRTIKSRSGHAITMDDDDSAAKVEIATSAGHKLTLDDSSGGETVTFEDKSGQNVIEFDAVGGSMTITSGAKISLSAPMLEIKGDGNVKLEAGGILTLKGALVKIN